MPLSGQSHPRGHLGTGSLGTPKPSQTLPGLGSHYKATFSCPFPEALLSRVATLVTSK